MNNSGCCYNSNLQNIEIRSSSSGGSTGPTGPTGATGATGPTGLGAVLAQPTAEGTVFGLTRPISSADGCSFYGYDTGTTYAVQIPNSNIFDTTIIGSFNMSNLDQSVNSFQNNLILGHSIISDVSAVTTMNGVFMVGGPFGSNVANINSSNLIGMGIGNYTSLINGRSLVSQANIITTTNQGFAAGNLFQGIVILGNTVNLGVTDNSICIGSGNTSNMNSVPGIVFNQGLNPYTNAGFSNCCAFIGSNPADATNDDQFIISYPQIYSPNLGSGTPSGNPQRLLYYDPTSGLIRPANTSGAYKRVQSFTGNTNAAGQVSFNLTSLGLSSTPVIVASVRNTSQTVAYTCNLISASSTNATFQVFNSVNAVAGSPTMVPAPINITVNVCVMY